MSSRIIINADDFGFSEGTNRAVRDLARLGTISSTSLMVNMPFVEEIREALAHSPHLGVGLHLNLTQGKPVTPIERVRTLVDSGGDFYPPMALLKRAWMGRVSMAEVRREVGAQIEAARELVGDRLDHWNSHQGSHRFEPFASVILAVCREYGIPAMRSHRHWFLSVDTPGQAVKAGVASLRRFGLRRVITETYYEWLSQRSARHFAIPAGLLTFLGRKSTDAFRYVAQAGTPPVILEIPCHPATTTRGLWGTRMLEQRVDEYKCLASDGFRAAVEDGRLRLLSFGELSQGLERGRRHEELEATAV
jgi:predicted glycoside hydrolase/deacetylase ChbG (UPF0249 family)